MRASLADIDIALSNLHKAVARFEAACDGVRLPAPSPVPAEVVEMQRRVVVARMWPMDPTGLMARVGPREYAEAHGL